MNKSNGYLSDEIKKHDYVIAKNGFNKNIPLHQNYLAMARMSFKDYITVYKMKNELIEELKNMIIVNMPIKTPDLLTKPFIIESINNDSLFGDIISIVGFYSPINHSETINVYKNNPEKLSDSVREELSGIINHEGNDTMLSILVQTKSYNENESWQKASLRLNNVAESKGDNFIRFIGLNIFSILPNIKKSNWNFDKIDYDRNTLMNKNYCRICLHRELCDKKGRYTIDDFYNFCFDGLCDNILSFITNFNYLLKAENTPIETTEKNEFINRAHTNKQNKILLKKEEWIIKYLYLNKEKTKYQDSDVHSLLNKEGFILKEIDVKEHKRSQAYGPNHSLRKEIKIESFRSTKWVKEGDKKIIVNYKNNK
jgi:hypothetical protein